MTRPTASVRRARLLVRICAFAVLLIGVRVSASEYTAEQKSRLANAIGARLERSAVGYGVDFSEWSRYVALHQTEIDSASNQAELEAALRDTLAEFGLSHLSLYSPSSGKLARAGKRAGLGVAIRKTDTGLFVTYTLPKSPAWECGIRKLDTIVSVDGEPIESAEQLFGSIGDRRRIVWLHAGERREATVEYGVFPVAETSSFRWLNDSVALIRVPSFQFGFYKLFRINRFFRKARNAEAIVIDLRNNAGGLSLYARHLASKIGSSKEIYGRLVNKRRYRRALAQAGDHHAPTLPQLATAARPIHPLPFSRSYRGKVVVLVDNLSASGADLFPAYVKENGKGIVIGDTTAGALALARTFRLPFGFRLYAPIGELLTPDGERLEGGGVVPDDKLDFREAADDDFILKLAIEEIQGKSRRYSSVP